MVIQRVSRAAVRVGSRSVSSIGKGLLVLLAIEKGDTEPRVRAGAEKVAAMRIFPETGSTRMNLSVGEIGGEILVVSQFTLAGSLRRGRRPSFDGAAPAEEARRLCGFFGSVLTDLNLPVKQGEFGAMMEVELVNEGPVTFWLESSGEKEFGP